MDNDNVVRMFWHGSLLSAYEQLSIASFLKQGHRVEVFSYGELNLPPGATPMDAATVLPEHALSPYQAGGIATYADLFRYKLLYERGGIWADSDVLCLRPMDALPPACVGRQDDSSVAVGVMRFPAGHALAGELYEHAAKLGPSARWAQTGPQLLTKLLPRHSDVKVLPAHAFYPIHWSQAWRLVTPEHHGRCTAIAQKSYAVHWWNEIFRRMGMPKDKLPPQGSFLERHAAALLDGERETWPSAAVAAWSENFRNARLAAPLKRYNTGRCDLADLLRSLGAAQLRNGHWQQAAELLAAAHQARPNGPNIRLLLAQALIALGKRAEADSHLLAALQHPSTQKRAQVLRSRWGL